MEERSVSTKSAPGEKPSEKSATNKGFLDIKEVKNLLAEKIKYWQGKLLDLTRRNRLISFRDYKRSTLLLDSPDIEIMVNRLCEGKTILFYKPSEQEDSNQLSLETTMGQPEKKAQTKPKDLGLEKLSEDVWVPNHGTEEAEKRLYYLYLSSRESLREQGINTLFVAIGFLHYFEAENSNEKLMAPLILIPIEIERHQVSQKLRHGYTIKLLEEGVQVNPALFQKLLKEFNIRLPAFTEETVLKQWLRKMRKTVEGKERWKISRNACLGIFSFQKLQIYLDIQKFKDLIFSHPLLQVLMGATPELAGSFENIPAGEELDYKVKPNTILQVLDADSSQQKVIEAAKAGMSFVVQGPPGTGKSQTIVNIIAELLAKNKKVLFVSEKMAALEVVKKRLDQVHLGRYCLELHSYKANKKNVLHQLGEQLNSKVKISVSKSASEVFPVLETTRQELNDLGRDLQTPRGVIQLSVYKARGNLAKLEEVPDIDFRVENPLEISKETFNQRLAQLSSLQSYENEISTFSSHSWKGLILKQLGLRESKDLRKLLSILSRNSQELSQVVKEGQKATGLPVNSIEGIDKLAKILRKVAEKPRDIAPLELWFTEDLHEAVNSIGKIEGKLERIKEVNKYLKSHYQKDYFNIAVEEILERFKTDFKWPIRFIKREYWKLRRMILHLAKRKRTFSEMSNDLQLLLEVKQLEIQIKRLEKQIAPFIKNLSSGGETDWSSLGQTIEWAQAVKSAGENNLPPQLLANLVNQDKSLKKLLDHQVTNYEQGFKQHLDSLLAYFEDQFQINDKPIKQSALRNLTEWINNLGCAFSQLKPWVDFNNLVSNLDSSLRDYALMFLVEIHEPSYFVDCYRKQFLEAFLEEAEQEIVELSGEYYYGQVERFRQADKEQYLLAQKRLMEILEKPKPCPDSLVGTSSSEVAILKREILKKRRYKPLRILFLEIPNLLFVLKPCFMMSPLSVCQYIDAERMKSFDTVIFDEASQIMTEDAISTLIRAKQAIIVGDSQQLPPTRFFSSYDGEDLEIREELEDLESILDNAAPRLKNEYLEWHYRSKDESLIAFSNNYFYENRLITFPNSSESPERGIEFILVENGVYDRGGSRKNIPEARRVVKLIENHIKQTPQKSLGVVAFSIQQQRAILDQIEMFRIQHPKFKEFFEENILNEFFVKNLENVQGDERDVMIFSVGYGPDAARKMSLNFGPINKIGGYRRLNVAITRAREKKYLVASFQPEAIDLTHTSNMGVKHLIQYMKYARDGVETIKAELVIDDVLRLESKFEEAVYDKLVARGWDVATQIGCSGYRIDLAVKHPKRKGEFVLGIECDGSVYHSSVTARDRDRLRQEVLEKLGWNIHRIWSTDWMLDSDREVKRIEEKISLLMEEKAKESPVRKDLLTIKEESKDDVPSFNFPAYETAQFKKRSRGIEAFNNAYGSDLGSDVLRVVERESPVHIDLVFRRVANAWGISRVGSNVRRKLLWAVQRLVNEKSAQREKKILWHKHKKRLADVRISKTEDRPIKFIPLQELGSLAVQLLQNAFSINKDDLVTEMARVYGYMRTGPDIKKHFGKAVNYLERVGLTRNKNGRIELMKG